MELVNVYDFDKTILPYDSTEAFAKFIFRRYPRAALSAAPCLPRLPLLLRGNEGKTRFKEVMYRFLTAVPDIETELQDFWDANFCNISAWYMAARRVDDVVISASPEFLLKIPAERLGVRLIATRVDKYTGETTGLNNSGEEKVKRLRAAYPGVEIDEFYSDSESDTPLARLAKTAYMVKNEQPCPWPWKE